MECLKFIGLFLLLTTIFSIIWVAISAFTCSDEDDDDDDFDEYV